jgi:hypothetical protein
MTTPNRRRRREERRRAAHISRVSRDLVHRELRPLAAAVISECPRTKHASRGEQN